MRSNHGGLIELEMGPKLRRSGVRQGTLPSHHRPRDDGVGFDLHEKRWVDQLADLNHGGCRTDRCGSSRWPILIRRRGAVYPSRPRPTA